MKVEGEFIGGEVLWWSEPAVFLSFVVFSNPNSNFDGNSRIVTSIYSVGSVFNHHS